MRTSSAMLAVALTSGAALLAACSGSGLSGTQSALPNDTVQAQTHFRSMYERSGLAPQFLQALRFVHVAAPPERRSKKLKDLAVSEFGYLGSVVVLDRKYSEIAWITNGLNGPDGDYYDDEGNLYVANYAGINVTEYNKANSLTFTYSSGLSDPVGVTTDSHGNVFVADFGEGGAGVVVEYAQASNSPTFSCNTGLSNEGIAVDNSGDVFVSGSNPNTGSGNIVEYKGGLSGCSGSTLGVTLGFPGGMQIDKHNNLVACDQEAGVDIIAPPYNSVSATISASVTPFHDALSTNNKLLFIADSNAADVLVVDYPSGLNVITLGSVNGLSVPAGVATYPFVK